MKKFVLFLNAEGNGFKCSREQEELSAIKVLKVSLSDDFDIPEIIKRALLCENRKETAEFIQTYLIPLESTEEESTYHMMNADNTPAKLVLYQSRVRTREPVGTLVFAPASKTTSELMLQLVTERSASLVADYRKGQEYQNTAWFSFFSWVPTLVKVKKEKISHSGPVGFVLGNKPTNKADDFERGRKESSLGDEELMRAEIDSALSLK